LASSAPDRPRVFATVLYWRAEEVPLVERCLASLATQDAPHVNLRVIVVDNGCGAVVRMPTGIDLLRLPENRGFTGGHNAGIRQALDAGADYVFLVNSDAILDEYCVQTLVSAARAFPQAGMLGPLVVRESDQERVESNGQVFDRWSGRHREIDRGAPVRAIPGAPHRADAVSGCALFVRRAVLEQVGLLDERLFFYFEDMDWCLRARQAGFDVLVVPEARVRHVGGGSTGPASPRTTFFSVRNHLTVAMRYTRLRRAIAPLIVAYHLAFLARAPERRSRVHLQAALSGALAGWRGALGPI